MPWQHHRVANKPPAGTPALVALRRAGVAFDVHDFEADPAGRSYGLAAAEAIGADAARVFKTLIAVVDHRPHCAIVPVSRQLSLKALAAAVGGKRAEMCEPAAAERMTGYVVGGISPFGQKKPLPTVLDTSAGGFPTIFVSGGRRGLDIEVAPATLVAVLQATVAPIATA
jgi:Cys-tRNA(Pro)/Cys-tRNA(Cys) deacylase